MSDRRRRGTGSTRWLFEPAPAERLAVLRLLVGAFAVIYLLVRLPVFLALAEAATGSIRSGSSGG